MCSFSSILVNKVEWILLLFLGVMIIIIGILILIRIMNEFSSFIFNLYPAEVMLVPHGLKYIVYLHVILFSRSHYHHYYYVMIKLTESMDHRYFNWMCTGTLNTILRSGWRKRIFHLSSSVFFFLSLPLFLILIDRCFSCG